MPDFIAIPGYRNWVELNTNKNNRPYPYTSIPPSYTPSNVFWVRAPSIHCNVPLPWTPKQDPFGIFLNGGGVSGTLIGSLGGLDAVARDLSQKTSQTWGIGRELPGPKVGYCIGTKFKENVYLEMNAIRGVEAFGNADIVQRSRYKRIYMKFGEVIQYSADTRPKIRLDINGTFSNKFNLNDKQIRIYKKNGAILLLTIDYVEENWTVVIKGIEGNFEPESGDFYEIVGETWCLEDPYLLSGFWMGTENENTVSKPKSGLNLYITTHNSPYEIGKFTGAYVYKQYPIEDAEDNEEEIPTIFEVPSENQDMSDGPMNFTWSWFPFNNPSEIHTDNKRYKELFNINEASGSVSYSYEERLVADEDEYSTFRLQDGLTFLRVELDKGGNSTRNNWHAPALKNQYIKWNGQIHKIINHFPGNIIDVRLNPEAGGNELFNPNFNQTYEILNQYAWMLNEHLMTPSLRGFLDGTTRNASQGFNFTGLNLDVLGENFATFAQNVKFYTPSYFEVNNFYNRFVLQRDHTETEPIKLYNKFKDWKLIVEGSSYPISDITFPNNISISESYSIEILLEGSFPNLSNRNAYVSFDEPYSRVGGYRGTLEWNVTEAVDELNQANLCIDGDWLSPPINARIDSSDALGVCDGFYFGIEANADTLTNNSATFYLTTTDAAGGISSLYAAFNQEDWIVYKDIVTNRITIRRNLLNYLEAPKKSEIAIGIPSSIQDLLEGETSIINLDTTQERLHKISFKVKESNDVLLLGNQSSDNTYGFFVGGKGNVDLQPLRRRGIGEDTLPSTFYQFNDLPSSPVYVYQKDYEHRPSYRIIDYGIDTTDGPIYVKNGSVDGIKLQYMKSNQTLTNIGLFDMVKLRTGEAILIYGADLGSFSIGDNVYNDEAQGNTWSVRKGVFAIGSSNNYLQWGTPTSYMFKKSDNNYDYQYPLLLLGGVQYLHCAYNSLLGTLCMIVRCQASSGFSSYIGMYSIQFFSVIGNEKRVSVSSERLPFLWRPPLLTNETLTNNDINFTPSQNMILDQFETNKDIDKFTRIIGPQGTLSQVIEDGDIDNPSLIILEDGTYVMLYGSSQGIKCVFSRDTGTKWFASEIILSRNGFSPLYLDFPLIVYIKSDGIYSKTLDNSTLFSMRDLSDPRPQGENPENLESIRKRITELQQEIDAIEEVSMGTGEIPVQRLTGYTDSFGRIKVYYYDNQGLLSSVNTDNGINWSFTDNF